MSDAPKKRQGGPRSAARLAAVQALYQIEMTDASASAVASDEFIKADEVMFRGLVAGAHRRGAELDALISGVLPTDWPLERLESVMRAVLRVACFELLERVDVPARVVITEYVDVAHAFFAGKEPGMVNGVLDKLAHQLRAAEWADARA